MLVLISAVFKRKGVLLLAPLLYISVMLLYMGSLGFDVVDLKSVVVVHKHAPPGFVYRSPQVFKKFGHLRRLKLTPPTMRYSLFWEMNLLLLSD